MKPYAYIDEVIQHIDSAKKMFLFFGKTFEESLRYVNIDRKIIPSLITSPKFSLPTLGQFYRPIEDLHAREDGKFNLYAYGYELDMLQFPPFEKFTIEFPGFDDKISIKTAEFMEEDVLFSKYVLFCQKVSDGISILPFYYNIRKLDVCPEGWITNYPVILQCQDLDDRVPNPMVPDTFGLRIFIENEPSLYSTKVGTTMGPEIRALLQFLVVLNVKKGILKEDVNSPRKMVARTGRQLGYTYHVLNIAPKYIINENKESMGGHHASPRFHLRRAHLRRLSENRFTFVKQTFVGDISKGFVDKDYKL